MSGLLRRTWAEIDISALVHNFNLIKSKVSPAEILAVVKANAYGHCDSEISSVLEKAGAGMFGVSNIEEALSLRAHGIKKPILILGYTPANVAGVLAENDISQCVYSAEYAELLSREAQKANVKIKIHIKLDTGMSRLGFDCRDDKLSGLEEALCSAKLDGFVTEGIFTHFAVSDRDINNDDGFTAEQYNRFKRAVEFLENKDIAFKYVHCCNSAASLLDKDKTENLVRPGIILYGLSPSSDTVNAEEFIPVMTLKSVVSMVKEIKSGDTVSYGRTFKAEKNMKIATVSAGYGDGYPRLLSNKAYVIINGKKAPLIGRVCMDQMSVDVTDIDDVKMGDEVILFGKELPVGELAKICSTISYEIVCGISPRVPRIILK